MVHLTSWGSDFEYFYFGRLSRFLHYILIENIVLFTLLHLGYTVIELDFTVGMR